MSWDLNYEESVTPRQHPKNFKYAIPRKIATILVILLIPAEYICIINHANKLKHTEGQLVETEDTLKQTQNGLRLQAASFRKAYKELQLEYMKLQEGIEKSKLVSDENQQKMDNSMQLITELLDENQGLIKDLGRSTAILENWSKRCDILEQQLAGLLEVLKQQGVEVEFKDQSAEK